MIVLSLSDVEALSLSSKSFHCVLEAVRKETILYLILTAPLCWRPKLAQDFQASSYRMNQFIVFGSAVIISLNASSAGNNDEYSSLKGRKCKDVK